MLESLFNKVTGLKACNLLKRESNMVFYGKFAKFLRKSANNCFYSADKISTRVT